MLAYFVLFLSLELLLGEACGELGFVFRTFLGDHSLFVVVSLHLLGWCFVGSASFAG